MSKLESVWWTETDPFVAEFVRFYLSGEVKPISIMEFAPRLNAIEIAPRILATEIAPHTKDLFKHPVMKENPIDNVQTKSDPFDANKSMFQS